MSSTTMMIRRNVIKAAAADEISALAKAGWEKWSDCTDTVRAEVLSRTALPEEVRAQLTAVSEPSRPTVKTSKK